MLIRFKTILETNQFHRSIVNTKKCLLYSKVVLYSSFSDDDVNAENVRDYSQAIGYHYGYHVSKFFTMLGVLGIVVFGISIF